MIPQREIAKDLAMEEYIKQIKLRTDGKVPDNLEILVESSLVTLPVRKDGSISLTLFWGREKVVEMYHKGPVSIIVGFAPGAINQGE